MKVQVLLQEVTLFIFALSFKMSNKCGEQLQHCAIITEEYERLIQESKRSAFRNCFTKEICNYELALFENCFERSVRAIRASFNREILRSDNFVDSANRYLSALENCFDTTLESTQFSSFKPNLIDEDAIYAHTIYTVEFADHLWGLPQLVPTYPYLENSATLACLIREKRGRMFGNGINRLVDYANIKPHDVNDSCLLEENEIQCYRQQLSNNRFYQELLIERDRIIRSCIRSVRLQAQCYSTDASRLRACLCSAREEFENRIQASILQCVRRSHTEYLNRERQQPQRQWHEQQDGHFDKPTFSGTIRNGDCLCTCPYNYVNFSDQEKLKHQIEIDAINDQKPAGQEQTGC